MYQVVKAGSLESVLSSSIISFCWLAFIVSASNWYGSTTQPVELNGPTRYHWDNAYFNQEIDLRATSSTSEYQSISESVDLVPDKLFVFDYVGSNPAKGGLFRSGTILKGDGIITSWLGIPQFYAGTLKTW